MEGSWQVVGSCCRGCPQQHISAHDWKWSATLASWLYAMVGVQHIEVVPLW